MIIPNYYTLYSAMLCAVKTYLIKPNHVPTWFKTFIH
jgi:hypothetical protein